jgi:hypothetical protein
VAVGWWRVVGEQQQLMIRPAATEASCMLSSSLEEVGGCMSCLDDWGYTVCSVKEAILIYIWKAQIYFVGFCILLISLKGCYTRVMCRWKRWLKKTLYSRSLYFDMPFWDGGTRWSVWCG